MMHVRIFLLVLIIIASGCVGERLEYENANASANSSANATEDKTDTAAGLQYIEKFIVTNPLDLSQVEKISKFRSCAGHDTPGYNAANEREHIRSMKHYISPEDSARSGKIKIFAPFDGTVYKALPEPHRGSQIYLHSDTSGEWYFVLYHSDLAPGISEGSRISAGQLVAHANVGQESDFDIGIETAGGLEKFSEYMRLTEEERQKMDAELSHLPKRDSMLLHMDDKVLQEFAAKGITAENAIISKAFRDQNPCKCADEECYFNTPHDDPENWVVLK